MNQEQAVHHTTLISGYHVSAAKKPCIIGKTKRTSLHSLSLIFNASQYFGMEESNVNFEFSLKLQFQGYYFHTSDVVNIQ